jgi:hypothetical protein
MSSFKKSIAGANYLVTISDKKMAGDMLVCALNLASLPLLCVALYGFYHMRKRSFFSNMVAVYTACIWFCSLVKVLFALIGNTLVHTEAVLTFTFVMKLVESTFRWVGVGANFAMVISFTFIWHKVQKREHVDDHILRKIAFTIVYIVVVFNYIDYIFAFNMLVTRTYVSSQVMRGQPRFLLIFSSILVQVWSLGILLYTCKSPLLAMAGYSKYDRIARGLALLMLSFAVFNIPAFIQTLSHVYGTKHAFSNLVYQWLMLEGIVTSVIVYKLFLKQPPLNPQLLNFSRQNN